MKPKFKNGIQISVLPFGGMTILYRPISTPRKNSWYVLRIFQVSHLSTFFGDDYSRAIPHFKCGPSISVAVALSPRLCRSPGHVIGEASVVTGHRRINMSQACPAHHREWNVNPGQVGAGDQPLRQAQKWMSSGAHILWPLLVLSCVKIWNVYQKERL